MATMQFGLLEEREENELHKARLMGVEERPYKRAVKNIIDLIKPINSKLPTPPPDGSERGTDGLSPTMARATRDPTGLKEDIVLDFAAFDSAIARLQFLATANSAERERYAADRLRILGTMEQVRSQNGELRTLLEEARATLAQRKRFDELADRIISNRMLRTRAEQEGNLRKLAEECEELERESETYSTTWRERKDQFDKLVEEGVNLRRIIRDEKEEVERREGMDEDGEDDEAETSKGEQPSGNATPRPDSPGHGATTSTNTITSTLKPGHPDVSATFSRGGSQAPSIKSPAATSTSRAGSQAPRADEPEGGEDVEMGESTQPSAETVTSTGNGESKLRITLDAPADPPSDEGDKMDTT